MILLTIMYGKCEVPDGSNCAEIARFIHSLIGGNLDNLKNTVRNPIKTKSDSAQSKRNRIKDLNNAIEKLKQANMLNAVETLENERNELIDDITDIKSEKKRKKFNQ